MATRVKEALQLKGISNEVVANILGIHRNTLSNKLSGESSFTVEEAFKIKRLLLPEYDMDYLFMPDPTTDNKSA